MDDDETVELQSSNVTWRDYDEICENETELYLEEVVDISCGSISSESEGSGDDCVSHVKFMEPLKGIWTTEQIQNDLEKLLDKEDVGLLTRTRKNETLTRSPGGLLWACWSGRPMSVQRILATGISPHVTDSSGRTSLHLAALVGNVECLSLLLQSGANVNQWDGEHRVTALHCATSAKSLACVQMLLNHGADVNAGINKKSPLHYAVESNAPDCVLELLKRGACPDTLQVFTETPLHVAAARGFTECLKILLKHGADARAQLGVDRVTALHLSVEEGHIECSKILIEAGASIDATNIKLQTPMHLASIAQVAESLELLIQKGGNIHARDINGRTPLHGSLGRGNRCTDCLRLLLAAKANVNQPDNYGYTPMHFAALNEYSGRVCLLLDHGGDVTLRTKGGHTVLSFIVQKTPEVIPKYIEKFDDAIKVTDHEIGDVDCELSVDLRPLVPTVGRQEASLLLSFIEVGRKDILKHPVCETFLYLKWRRIRKFFLLSLAYHTLFVILYSIYIIGVFLRNCPSVRSRNASDFCKIPWYIKTVGYTLICLNSTLLIKEVFQIFHDFKGYLKQWENWLQCLIILGVFFCAIPGSESIVDMASWKHHIAAITIFLVWVELMIIVGRFPMFGLYVQMFRTVALNFSKFLMAYSCLLLAFGFSFGVLFANYPSFKNIFLGILKTIIMMSGELEYEDIFYNNNETSPLLYPVTTHILFLAFVLLVTVILTNLLVGLAVSDIQALQESAGLDRLVRQAELVAKLESMLFSSLLHWVPPQILAMLHKAALLLASRYHWALYIRPNDPREKRVPKYLISSIYKLAAGRKDLARNLRMNRKNLIHPEFRHSVFNHNKNIPNHNEIKKTASILRPRTKSDLSNIKPRSFIPSNSENDIKTVIVRINEIKTKLNLLQQQIENKFHTIEKMIVKNKK